ncbi:ATP-dependent RNA helicase RhlE [uncultured Candidatus Thioglobus sp.]|nr:ATP-dependent RNA helicase RhlE [uncultured Candidatus Thioglobus sp.]
MKFSELALSDNIQKAIGYPEPSPIQAQAIPAILAGKDVMAAAQTGTGKTAGFTLPILQLLSQGTLAKSNHVRALILTPTRELAAQVSDNVATYGKHLPLKSGVVFGGVKINPQMQKLRSGMDILVATPGRLLDLYSQNAVKFDQLEIIVFDEADRMLDMGFIHDIKRILKILPPKRQTLMFSATFSDEIRKLAKTLVANPVEISVTPRNTTVKAVKQWIHPVDKSKKQGLLTHLIKEHSWYQVLVFSRTKHGANRIATQLGKRGITAVAIHGNKSQGARTRALADFKNGKVNVLVATDIAARGIDIVELPHVVNFDLPNVPEDYVHRIGRTGRAGSKGEAISLVSADEAKQLFDIERLTQKKLERIMVDDFIPDHNLPETGKNLLPPKNKKPKKNKSRNKPRYGKNSNSTENKNKQKKGFWGNKSKK